MNATVSMQKILDLKRRWSIQCDNLWHQTYTVVVLIEWNWSVFFFTFWKPTAGCPEQYFNKSICQKPSAFWHVPVAWQLPSSLWCTFRDLPKLFTATWASLLLCIFSHSCIYWTCSQAWCTTFQYTQQFFLCITQTLPLHFLLLYWECIECVQKNIWILVLCFLFT